MLPSVSIVSVNYNGRRWLEGFLASLLALDYPADRVEILLVDNASRDDSVPFVRERFPGVHVIASTENRGFAGGCNLGIRSSSADFVALVNNDTVVDRGWLRGLVEAAADPRVGMVGSKVVFYTRFLDVGLQTDGVVPAQAGLGPDERTLGLRLYGAHVVGCDYDKLIVLAGGFGPEFDGAPFRWLSANARLAVPVASAAAPATLVLDVAGHGATAEQPLRVLLGGRVVTTRALSATRSEVRVTLEAPQVEEARDLVNNAGSFLDADGGFGDRGIYEFDRGQYDRVEDLSALCGASLLLRRAMLDRVGLFDERFFMYFEDSDLSWRARRAGWRLVYTPHAVVRHIHAGSSGEWSPLFTYYVTRNHLYWMIKHGRGRVALARLGRFVGRTLRDGGRALAARVTGRAAPPRPGLRIDARVSRDLVRALPGLLRSRWAGDEINRGRRRERAGGRSA